MREIRTKNWEAFIIKAGIHYTPRGWGNGYVLIPYESILYWKDSDRLDELLSKHLNFYVHGGITLSCPASDFYTSDRTNSFYGKIKKGDNRWLVGFDTNHAVDEKLQWSMKLVKHETRHLRDALMKLDKLMSNTKR